MARARETDAQYQERLYWESAERDRAEWDAGAEERARAKEVAEWERAWERAERAAHRENNRRSP